MSHVTGVFALPAEADLTKNDNLQSGTATVETASRFQTWLGHR